ncbi:MAG: hypothetical protein GXZ11_00325 [Tissierellia bacterium]|nr:hypothetical protein [Tissierellia bacterium]
MRIQIYTCQFGNGHNAQAKALQNQLSIDYETELVDVCEALFPLYDRMIYYSYRKMVEKNGLMLKLFHKMNLTDADNVNNLNAIKKWSFNYMDNQPLADAWIATHSATAYFLAAYKRERRLTIPLITCITDVNPHDIWINEGTDLYLVAAPSTQNALIEAGVHPDNIVIYGLSGDQSNLNKKPVACGESLHLLISGGGLGLLPKDLSFYRTISQVTNAELRILCGKNKTLVNKLRKANIPGVSAFGFTNDIVSHLKWVHVFVGKPGGLSTFEAIYSEIPILFLEPFLKQENYNGQFIEQEGIGWELSKLTLEQIAYERKNLSYCQMNMKRLKACFEPEKLLEWLREYEQAVA